MRCIKCNAPVSFDEAGLNKKLIRRDLTEFLCIDCLARKFDVSQARLREKTEEYRRMGCVLFAQPCMPSPIQTKTTNETSEFDAHSDGTESSDSLEKSEVDIPPRC